MTEFPDDYSDIPHLRRIDEATVTALCARLDALKSLPVHIKREAMAFVISRTPWDATRLANALHHWDGPEGSVGELVRDLDAVAEECAGVPMTNKQSRG